MSIEQQMRAVHYPATSRTDRASEMASGLKGSEILKIAGEIRTLMASGTPVTNLTVGDFSPREFRIPTALGSRIEAALRAGETNYPPSDGMPALREAVVRLYEEWLGLRFPLESIIVAGGARPVIYAAYRAVVDPGDTVLYPVPSWNNNHYCHVVGAKGVPLRCRADQAFLPTAESIAPYLEGARLLALNSPLNPTGTAFDAGTLTGICELIVAENRRRGTSERPLYLLYDQVYWMLTFGDTRHVDPISVCPEIAPYTIYVDGISKPFAATGLRVGWTAAPPDIAGRMASLLGHMGAWAPRAEQVATASLLGARDEIESYHAEMKRGVQARLDALYAGIESLHRDGYPVEAIPPMGAIYLSARLALNGLMTKSGERLETNDDVRRYLLRRAGAAVVQFQAFGAPDDDGWFRLSVGAVSLAECEALESRLREALADLRDAS